MCPAREGWAVKLNKLVLDSVLQIFKAVLHVRQLVPKEFKAGLVILAVCNTLLEAIEHVGDSVHL